MCTDCGLQNLVIERAEQRVQAGAEPEPSAAWSPTTMLQIARRLDLRPWHAAAENPAGRGAGSAER
jgi:hypothetical protein